MIVTLFSLLGRTIKRIWVFPQSLVYFLYDMLVHSYCYTKYEFKGYGIHLYCGYFGQGKTQSMVNLAYHICKKNRCMNLLTNIDIQYFPYDITVTKLKCVNDILNAKPNTIIFIDEIGTLFNSRDFMKGGKDSVPKVLFQLLCQNRKKKLMLIGTASRFTLIDKQIRDVTEDVTLCTCKYRYPYSRIVQNYTYDIEEYECYVQNRNYVPRMIRFETYIQTNHIRECYSSSSLVTDMLTHNYEDDETILRNRGSVNTVNYAPSQKKRFFGGGFK